MGGACVHVCVGGKIARSQTTCGPQARFVPALLGEARQTPPQWCACASVTPGLCMGAPTSFYRPLMMKRTRPSVCRGPFLSGHKWGDNMRETDRLRRQYKAKLAGDDYPDLCWVLSIVLEALCKWHAIKARIDWRKLNGIFVIRGFHTNSWKCNSNKLNDFRLFFFFLHSLNHMPHNQQREWTIILMLRISAVVVCLQW